MSELFDECFLGLYFAHAALGTKSQCLEECSLTAEAPGGRTSSGHFFTPVLEKVLFPARGNTCFLSWKFATLKITFPQFPGCLPFCTKHISLCPNGVTVCDLHHLVFGVKDFPPPVDPVP